MTRFLSGLLFALSLGLMFAIDSLVSKVWPQAKAGTPS